MNKLFFILIFFKSVATFGAELSHPPTFEQIRQAYKHDDLKQEMLVVQALEYTDDDIETIKKQNNINYIIGASYQTYRHQGCELLTEYFSIIQNDPVGLSLLISFALQSDVKPSLSNIGKLTDILIRLEPANSFSYYLKAYYYSKIGKPGLCYNYLQQGNRKNFNNFFKELSVISINTSLFLGYSKIAAQIHALGLQHDVLIYKNLAE